MEVNRLAHVSQDSWFPEVPPGTLIADHVNGGTITIPFSEEQEREIASADGLPLSAEKNSVTFRVFCIALGMVVIAVGGGLYYARKKI